MQDLSYSQLLYLSKEIAPKLLHTSLLSFQEIGRYKWALVFSNGLSLLVCLQHPFVRFHLIKKIPPSISSPFCKKIEKTLANQKLTVFSLIHEDRILLLRFEQQSLIFELFSRGANLYLLDSNNLILCSYVPVEKKIYSPPPKRKEPLIENVDPSFLTQIETLYQKAEAEAAFLNKKKEILQQLNRGKMRAEKELKKWEKIASFSPTKYEEAILLQRHYHLLKKGLRELEIEENGKKQTIPLNPSLSPAEQLDFFFRKAKREKAEALSREQKKGTVQKSLREYEELIKKVDTIATLEELSSLFPPPSKKTSPFLFFITSSQDRIYVGRNEQENDRLTFTFAKGRDFWFHAADAPGAHVILKAQKAPPEHESILDAAHVALFYSKAKENREGDVWMVERKNLSRVKNKMGQVNISKPKKIHVKLDLRRIERLKKESLKES